MRAWDEGRNFRTLLEADERVTVAPAVLDAAFDVERSLRHVPRVFAALDAIGDD